MKTENLDFSAKDFPEKLAKIAAKLQAPIIPGERIERRRVACPIYDHEWVIESEKSFRLEFFKRPSSYEFQFVKHVKTLGDANFDAQNGLGGGRIFDCSSISINSRPGGGGILWDREPWSKGVFTLVMNGRKFLQAPLKMLRDRLPIVDRAGFIRIKWTDKIEAWVDLDHYRYVEDPVEVGLSLNGAEWSAL